MKENHTPGRAPSIGPGPEGPAVGMVIRQDPAQGARAAGPEGDITVGGSIFGPDGAGQFVRLGETQPQPAAREEANAPPAQAMPREAGKLPHIAETSGKQGPNRLNGRPIAGGSSQIAGIDGTPQKASPNRQVSKAKGRTITQIDKH